MLKTNGYAAMSATTPPEPFAFERREPGEHDVLIEILFCGVCHSDIHQARGEWNNSTFPMVPGHEIVGRVARVGAAVTKFREGDMAGVGCFVDSCRVCDNCREGLEQYCEGHTAATYNGTEMDEKTPTYGGYSTQIVVDENYTLRIPAGLDPAGAAPLLCAGITTYSPLRHFNVREGQRVGVVGLGGLGHMGVKLAASMGADVTVFSTSPSKEGDARQLGAHHFVVTREPESLAPLANKFDLILDTVSAPHDVNLYLNLLRRDGVMVLVGVPEKPVEVQAFSVISNRRRFAGSSIGGIRETQEMLDYCAERRITSDVEVIPIQRIEEAYERTVKADVRYRFVIDIDSLRRGQ
ncbi:MAG: NAD(P)-dependent alcohol dehydrogenase [Acidobacteria bacterium]|nr:NAD(P)-dependent alcohol dehydrogenase [Acidobacteriota bacterium]MCA1640479.1 NAD(P)-dependent alcohol dehydrogenase [Acidobacteriota bacterium]